MVREAHPGFDVAVKYGLLMYAIDADWRHWVCAIGSSRSGLSLKFLFGVLLSDPKHVLRAGSSVLMSWDLGSADDLDEAGIAAYVREAVERYPEFRADEQAILASAREAAASDGRRPKAAAD
jgi:hypothetical protein